jgi:hypothetical protein
MGQYYKPVNTLNLEWVYSHAYDNGLKLMEHSWVGNNFVGVVMNLLKPTGRWFKAPLVWCGDYYNKADETPYYSMVKEDEDLKGLTAMSEDEQRKSILVNFSKKEYVVIDKGPESDMDFDTNFTWVVNPLPLLTACGNNRGGGDYRDGNPDFNKVGIWANDCIGVLDHVPYGFWELVVGFED